MIGLAGMDWHRILIGSPEDLSRFLIEMILVGSEEDPNVTLFGADHAPDPADSRWIWDIFSQVLKRKGSDLISRGFLFGFEYITIGIQNVWS